MSGYYASFLARKTLRTNAAGPIVADADIHPFLHPWQRQIVAWAVRTGRAAVWADTGLGKTVMQLEWARLSGRRALVLAPLAVCHQTVREAAKIGLAPRYLREDDGLPGIVVTNYEISDHFDAAAFDAVSSAGDSAYLVTAKGQCNCPNQLRRGRADGCWHTAAARMAAATAGRAV